jgi:hypothetical protein
VGQIDGWKLRLMTRMRTLVYGVAVTFYICKMLLAFKVNRVTALGWGSHVLKWSHEALEMVVILVGAWFPTLYAPQLRSNYRIHTFLAWSIWSLKSAVFFIDEVLSPVEPGHWTRHVRPFLYALGQAVAGCVLTVLLARRGGWHEETFSLWLRRIYRHGLSSKRHLAYGVEMVPYGFTVNEYVTGLQGRYKNYIQQQRVEQLDLFLLERYHHHFAGLPF